MGEFERIEAIRTSGDLAKFVAGMAKEYREDPTGWENADLHSFLEALAGWIDDMGGYYKNLDLPFPATPEWKTLALMLSAAKVYE
jgi:hypothetical protein